MILAGELQCKQLQKGSLERKKLGLDGIQTHAPQILHRYYKGTINFVNL